MRQFTTIKGRFSEARELPRIGKIRLGLKVQSTKGTSYPTETEYFVCPPEVQEVYGETPTELDVLLPSNNLEDVFRSKYAMYGAGAGLKCHGNGEEAERYNEQSKQFEPRACPCEFLKSDANPKGTCTAKSDLMVMLPLVSMGGCYQIKTGSAAATKNINSSIELVKMLTGGRFAFLPMKLRRVPIDMTHEGHKRTHYIVTLTLNATWQQALQLRQHPDSLVIPAEYQIAAPLDENPELDPDDLVVEADVLAEADEAELANVQAALKKQAELKGTLGLKPTPASTAQPHRAVVKPAPVATLPLTTPAPGPGLPPAQMPLEEAPEPKSERFDAHLIPPHKWSALIQYIDTNPDLACLKEDWKADRQVDNVLRLTGGGQQALLAFFREHVKEFPY